MIDFELYTRQTGLIKPELLGFPIQMIGVGGIGSWTALALLKMGCQNLRVVDFDSVEAQNVGSQLYTKEDISLPKVVALQSQLRNLTDQDIIISNDAWTPTQPSQFQYDYIVISAVDNIETRKKIFEELKPLMPSPTPVSQWFIDGRMAGNQIQIYCIPLFDPEKVAFYEKTLFEAKEADPTPCTERAVVYNVFIVAGLIADMVAQIANGKTPPQELELDLINFTMYGGLE